MKKDYDPQSCSKLEKIVDIAPLLHLSWNIPISITASPRFFSHDMDMRFRVFQKS